MSPEEKKREVYRTLYCSNEKEETHWGYTIAYILAKELSTPLPTAMNMRDVDALEFIKLHEISLKQIKNMRRK